MDVAGRPLRVRKRSSSSAPRLVSTKTSVRPCCGHAVGVTGRGTGTGAHARKGHAGWRQRHATGRGWGVAFAAAKTIIMACDQLGLQGGMACSKALMHAHPEPQGHSAHGPYAHPPPHATGAFNTIGAHRCTHSLADSLIAPGPSPTRPSPRTRLKPLMPKPPPRSASSPQPSTPPPPRPC